MLLTYRPSRLKTIHIHNFLIQYKLYKTDTNYYTLLDSGDIKTMS